MSLVAASLLNTLEACYPLPCMPVSKKQTFQTPWRASKKGGQGMLLKVWESIPNILNWMALGGGREMALCGSDPARGST